MSSFFVPNLRNSLLLRAICALNLSILHRNLLCPDLIRGSLAVLCLLLLPLPAHVAADTGQEDQPAGSLGQKIYVPAYSRVHLRNGNAVPLAATLAIHNTDQGNAISIDSVAYFDSDGQLVEQQVSEARPLAPLATASFFVKSDDLRGGDGANFLVSWHSAKRVSPPVAEAIMVGTFGTRAFSFVSQGRVLGRP